MLNLDINWGNPYQIKTDKGIQWRREWLIPTDYLYGFFNFWRTGKFVLKPQGFSVYKDKDENWYLTETQNSFANFKNIGKQEQVVEKEEEFWVAPYELKDKSILREWQIPAASKLIGVVNEIGNAVDGSDMGVGKTYVSCGVVKELNTNFVVICPKAVIFQWEDVIKNHFNLGDKLKGIINYELLTRGRKDSEIASYVTDRQTHRNKFKWKIPKNSVIIWDEAHRLNNWKTKNSKVCMEAHKQGYKMLFLSGTLASSPLDVRTIGTCLGMFKTAKEYYNWAYRHGVVRGRFGLEFDEKDKENDEKLKKLHKYFFIERGVRLRRDNIPNFPETEIIVNAYNMEQEDTDKINEVYNEMNKELEVLKKKSKLDNKSELTVRIRALQQTELLKIPLIIEMVNEGLKNGMSVVLFLTYSATIDSLAERLNTKNIYDGRNLRTRQHYLDLFQENKERLLITNSAAAREGLGLADTDGNFPRLSIISPTYSIKKLSQNLRRIHRENSKSKSIQKMLYIANTQEERVVISVGKKLQNLTMINNGEITDADLKI